nr:tetratricopeptide repeat protein [Calditrichia bacterium]
MINRQNGRLKVSQVLKTPSEVERFRNRLEKSSGFALYFAVYDEPASLKKNSTLLKKSLGKACQEISLEKATRPIDFMMEKIGELPPEVLVHIPDFSITRDKALEKDGTDLLELLNVRLFELREIKRPLLLSLSLDMFEELSGGDFDVWDWRNGLFSFEAERDYRFRNGFFLLDLLHDTDPCRFVYQKQQQLKFYHHLQREYQSREFPFRTLYDFHVLGKIGRLYYRLGEYDEATNHFFEQRRIAESMGEQRLMPEILNNLAIVQEGRGQFAEARDLIEKALDIVNQVFRGEHNPTRTLLYSNLGDVQCSLGSYGEALKNCRQALRMQEYKLGQRHPDMLPVLVKLARVYRKRGQFEDALDCCRRGLHIIERKLDLHHPYISSMLQQIALNYFEQGKHLIAKRYIDRTLENAERYLGSEHPFMGLLLEQIGRAFYFSEDYEKALKYFYWALDIRNRKIGPGDLAIAHIYINVARVYLATGNVEDARNALQGSLALFRITLPQGHPEISKLEKLIAENPELASE